ncbi:unnamed protein product [Symbiodinium sp. CCMP2456]|nr:unnamed protein product [Symbiodinium sp. CCMP2456]
MSTKQTIAVVWASAGGLGDVGKLAAMHAKRRDGVELRAVAISEDGQATGIETTEVVPVSRRETLQKEMEGVEILKLNISDNNCREQLATVFQGCDAVVACPGSRQSGIACTCAIGARQIVAAMQQAGVSRLVVLSSFGIGDDYLPCSCIGCFWSCLLGTAFRSTKRDLEQMEEIVSSSNLDYLLVRPLGVDPAELPRNSYKLVTARGQGNLPITVSKEDVALYLFEEAVAPAHSKMGVTIGKDDAAKIAE